MKRPCLDCGTLTEGSRCPRHRRAKDRRREANRPSPRQRGYGEAWRKIRDPIIEAWRAEHGEVCPGYGRAAHAVVPPNVLTVDHIVPKVQGGDDDPSNLTVLCKSCQGRKSGKDRAG